MGHRRGGENREMISRGRLGDKGGQQSEKNEGGKTKWVGVEGGD